MWSFFLNRPPFARLALLVIAVAQFFGCVALAQTGTNPPPAAPLLAVRRAMREFDRFLDHHPLLEDELRLRPALVDDVAYLGRSPELGDFLAANPGVRAGLKLHPRYFLYRALQRQAETPLRFSEIAQLKEVLDAQPALERALNRDAHLIRNPAFLEAHAPLRDFLTDHPELGRVFLPRAEVLAGKT